MACIGPAELRALPWAPVWVWDLMELEAGFRSVSFSRPDLAAAARESAEIGRREALRWSSDDLEAELSRRGVEVRRIEHAPGGNATSARISALTSVDGASGGVVRLFMNEIARKGDALLAAGVPMSIDELVTLHLAHEFYHVLEFSSGCLTADRVSGVRVRRLLGVSRSRSSHAGEVAAHAFAAGYAGAPMHPRLLDAIVQVVHGECERDELDGRLRGLLKMYEGII